MRVRTHLCRNDAAPHIPFGHGAPAGKPSRYAAFMPGFGTETSNELGSDHDRAGRCVILFCAVGFGAILFAALTIANARDIAAASFAIRTPIAQMDRPSVERELRHAHGDATHYPTAHGARDALPEPAPPTTLPTQSSVLSRSSRRPFPRRRRPSRHRSANGATRTGPSTASPQRCRRPQAPVTGPGRAGEHENPARRTLSATFAEKGRGQLSVTGPFLRLLPVKTPFRERELTWPTERAGTQGTKSVRRMPSGDPTARTAHRSASGCTARPVRSAQAKTSL